MSVSKDASLLRQHGYISVHIDRCNARIERLAPAATVLNCTAKVKAKTLAV